MPESTKKVLSLRLIKLLHLTVTIGLFFLYQFFFGSASDLSVSVAGTVLYLTVFFLIGRTYDIYAVGSSRVLILLYSHGLTHLITAALTYVVQCLLAARLLSPIPVLVLMAVEMVWALVWCLLANAVYFRVSPPRPAVIFFDDDSELHKMEEIRYFDKKFFVTELIRTDEGAEAAIRRMSDAKVAFLVGVKDDVRSVIIKHCVTAGVQCYVLPRVGDLLLVGADQMHTFSVPFLRIRRAAPAPEYLLLKRAFDIFASATALLILSPFMLITALAIKLYDGGPVLYRQVRLTQNHREFKVLKFRSMRVDAEKDGVARLASENDDRITPIGKIIRKIRFDELPQLINILRGDMTIVGPRPERPEIAEQYEKDIPSFGLRLQVKAGLTGYAQIYGRYNTEPLDKLKMDLIYINNMSAIEDLRLIFATVKILFLPESTQGVAEGQTTAAHAEAKEKTETGAESQEELQNT